MIVLTVLPRGACWVVTLPLRALGRCHPFRRCSGLLALSKIMVTLEVTLSPFSPYLDIGLKEGKSQRSSHTVTFMMIAQILKGLSQSYPFITRAKIPWP